MIYQGKYGQAKTLTFALADFSGSSFVQSGITFSAGDCKISKDSGTFNNTSGVPTHVGRGIYALALGVTAMQAARIDVVVIDSSTTKVWHDQHIKLETYGDDSGEHRFDLDASAAAVNISLKKNIAFSNFPFFLFENTGSSAAVHTGTITSEVSLDGAAFQALTNTASSVGVNGMWKINLAAADTNASVAVYKFSAAGSKTSFITSYMTNF